MTSVFLSTFTQINIDHVTSIAQTVSQSGVRQSQRRSPVFYRFTVKYPIMEINSARHIALKNVIISNQYGNLTFTSTIPSSTGLLTSRGDYTRQSAGVPLRTLTNQSGYAVTIGGFRTSRTNVVRVGDFIQITDWSKVLQITTDGNSNASGQVVCNINSSYPLQAFDHRIRTGHDVIFTLMVEKRPEPMFMDGHLVQYSDGVFREVL